jgi:hypothetical protein
MNEKNNIQGEYITASEAMKIVSEEFHVSITPLTLRNWCKEHGIGKKIVGRWYVNPEKLKTLLRENND